MAGYVLVLAILILGGIIATLGDRIGTKVGKARLSVFNLRPRNTATLITIATGGMISASTLGVLLATSSQLRDGLFRLDSIRADLTSATTEKEKVQAELADTKLQRDQEKRNLEQINNSLVEALFRQSRTQSQLQSVQRKFQNAKLELEQVQAQEQELIGKIQELNQRQKSLVADSKKLTDERDQLNIDLKKITSDRTALRNRVNDSQIRLSVIEKQRTTLNAELKTLETSREQLTTRIQALRTGILTLRAGNFLVQSEQVLTAAVVNEGLSASERRLAVLQVLQEADQSARVLLDFPAASRPVIQVSEAQIDNIVQKLADGKSYILRILSAGNYLRKENNVAILADVTPNREVFKPGELIASLQFKPNMSDAEIEGQLDKLFLLVSFRARQQGVLPNPFTGKVGNFPQSALFDLTKEFKQYKSAIEIQAIAKDTIFTGSPLTLTLVVLENGVEIRRFG